MSAAALHKPRITPLEYLVLERASMEKHEYFDGEIFAMAGCTGPHDTIASNVNAALNLALRGGPCQPHTSDMKINIPATGLFTYSDGLVVCGPEYVDETKDTLTNPCVIFEVLSDSSEAYDRGKKFLNYRSLPSLKDYVLASQHAVLVEHYARQPDGTWTLRELRHAEDVLRLTGVSVQIPIRDLYLWLPQLSPM